ncbi:hypothetical protein [Streptomyces abikoensis]|uniref:Uncharacterized protein n=1 Tax=Streptomyces abikoensis TaxID=97398 RepID=A0ABW7T4N6_9ACTN
MSSRLTTLRTSLAIGGAVMMLVAIPTSSSAATGQLQYLRADNNVQDVLDDPPSDSCRPIPGGAVNATNRTDSFATLYKNSVCDAAHAIKKLSHNGGSGAQWDSGTTLVVADRVVFTAT